MAWTSKSVKCLKQEMTTSVTKGNSCLQGSPKWAKAMWPGHTGCHRRGPYPSKGPVRGWIYSLTSEKQMQLLTLESGPGALIINYSTAMFGLQFVLFSKAAKVLEAKIPQTPSLLGFASPRKWDISNTLFSTALRTALEITLLCLKIVILEQGEKEFRKYQQVPVNIQKEGGGEDKRGRNTAAWLKIQASLDWTSVSSTPFACSTNIYFASLIFQERDKAPSTTWWVKQSLMSKAKFEKAQGLMVRMVLISDSAKKMQHCGYVPWWGGQGSHSILLDP